GIGPGHANGGGIGVKRPNRLITQLCRRNGKNPGAGDDVQERLALSDGSPGCQLLHTKGRGRMLSGAKTHARIKHHDGLACPRTTSAPTRLDQQGVTDLERFEMLFPRLLPVLGRDPSNSDPAGAEVETVVSEF